MILNYFITMTGFEKHIRHLKFASNDHLENLCLI